MNCRYLGGSLRIITLIVLAPVATTAQGTNRGTAPKTPWGDPDLQGTYTNKTITPVQRPDELGERAFLTDEEIAELEREQVQRNARLLLRPALRTTVSDVARGVDGAPGAYNNFWLDRGTRAVGTRRTSLIMDPPTGRLPDLTDEAIALHVRGGLCGSLVVGNSGQIIEGRNED